jgi:sulfotransferase
LLSAEQRPEILRCVAETFCRSTSDCEVFFDTNRLWSAKMPLLADLFPGAKVIACVRDVPWILDSLERLFRRDPYENTRLFGNDGERATVYSRMECLARHNRLVGYPWTALKEAFYGEQSAELLVVDYEILAKAPEKTLRLIYQFINEPWYEGHDFENVDYDAPKFDEALGVSGLHRVRPRVTFEARKTILPPDLFQKFENMDFWKDSSGSAASVITVKNASANLQPTQKALKITAESVGYEK